MNVNKVIFSFIRVASIMVVILAIIYGAKSLCSVAYDLGYRVFTETAVDEAPGRDMLVVIKEDTKEKEIGEILEEKGLIRDANLFYIQLKLSAFSGKIVPGTYTLNTSMTPKDMIVKMAPEPIEETESTEAVPTQSAAEEEGSTEVEGAGVDGE